MVCGGSISLSNNFLTIYSFRASLESRHVYQLGNSGGLMDIVFSFVQVSLWLLYVGLVDSY